LQQKIINEVTEIIKSESFQNLCKAFKEGKATSIKINTITIVSEPEAPISGMTLFNENGFVLGKEAFTSDTELIKTLLHEIYRLKKSSSRKTGLSKALSTKETKDAYEFAERAIKLFFL
jgi:hypothetical protein